MRFRFSKITKIISTLLIISFLAYDISWGYPADHLSPPDMIRTLNAKAQDESQLKWCIANYVYGKDVASFDEPILHQNGDIVISFNKKYLHGSGIYFVPCEVKRVGREDPDKFLAYITKDGTVLNVRKTNEPKTVRRGDADTSIGKGIGFVYTDENLDALRWSHILFNAVTLCQENGLSAVFPIFTESEPILREYKDKLGSYIPAAIVAHSTSLPVKALEHAMHFPDSYYIILPRYFDEPHIQEWHIRALARTERQFSGAAVEIEDAADLSYLIKFTHDEIESADMPLQLKSKLLNIQGCMAEVDFPGAVFLVGSTLVGREGADVDIHIAENTYSALREMDPDIGVPYKLHGLEELLRERLDMRHGFGFLHEDMKFSNKFNDIFQYGFIYLINRDYFVRIDASIGEEAFISHFVNKGMDDISTIPAAGGILSDRSVTSQRELTYDGSDMKILLRDRTLIVMDTLGNIKLSINRSGVPLKNVLGELAKDSDEDLRSIAHAALLRLEKSRFDLEGEISLDEILGYPGQSVNNAY